jgi:uracil-DNA glycosylase family 4
MLHDMLITAVCRCVPPENKPDRSEITNCLPYLVQELQLMGHLQGFVVLGRIAFDNVLGIFRTKGAAIPRFEFKHAGIYYLAPDLPWLVASYHPSQQNTLTGRLTVEMFDQIWKTAQSLLR